MFTMNRRQFLLGSLLLPLLVTPRPPTRYAQRPRPALPPGMPQGFGCGIPWQNEELHPGWNERSLDLLKPAWWFDWQFEQIGSPGYVPMLWRLDAGALFDRAVELANAQPSVFWLLFDSPDRPGEAQTAPTVAAQRAQAWAAATDSPFSVAGIAFSPAGVQWLQSYLDAGGPVPAAWHLNLYGSAGAVQWRRVLDNEFATWYLAEGGDLPIIINATNANVGDFVQQEAVMQGVVDVLAEMSPIVAIGWYSDYDPFRRLAAADLVTAEGELTPLGQVYAGLDK